MHDDRLSQLIDAHAASGAAAGRLDDEVTRALAASGLFKLFLPPAWGGLGLGLVEAASRIAEVAEADAAAGWAVMIGAGPNWFAGRMAPALAEEVFGPPDACVAGSGALGHAVADGGGWRVTGRWRWCSGAPWATWFTFNAASDDGERFTFAVPRAEVVVHPDSWDVAGLRASASWDVELQGVVVPPARVFRIERPVTRPEPVFAVPFPAFAEATMAAVSVGAGRRALRLFARLAEHKVPTHHDRALAEDPLVADRFARVVAAARAADVLLQQATVEVVGRSGERNGDLALAAVHVAEVGSALARTLWDLSGMTVLPLHDPLGRVLLDLQAAAQNAVLAPARFAELGRSLLHDDR